MSPLCHRSCPLLYILWIIAENIVHTFNNIFEYYCYFLHCTCTCLSFGQKVNVTCVLCNGACRWSQPGEISSQLCQWQYFPFHSIVYCIKQNTMFIAKTIHTIKWNIMTLAFPWLKSTMWPYHLKFLTQQQMHR